MLEWLERTKQPRTTNQTLLLLNFEWMKSEGGTIIIFNNLGYSDVFSTKYKFKIVRIILSICYTFTLFFRENSRSPSKEKSKSRSRSIEKNGDRSPEIKEDN